MADYREIVEINDKFQNAVNLQMDLNNFEKINSFIPTRAAVDILKSMLMDICFNTSTRANVLIGPYGKGKSHIFLVLLGIISISDDEDQGGLNGQILIDRLVKRIEDVDPDTADLIRNIRQTKTRLLPVLVNSNYSDLKQAFLTALRNALDSFELGNTNLYTYFDAVNEVINRWKDKYPSSSEQFIAILKNEYNKNYSDFCDEINNFNSNTYDIFCQIYPVISSGSEFNPLTECDTVSLLKDVNDKITSENGFSGIFIVFDEFSKYLESSIKSDISLELKLLQDIAEFANRSNETQLHLTCIAHKGISEYTSHIPKRRVDPYRAVEGRFREIHFVTSIESSYELIANAIIKNKDRFLDFYEQYERNFIALKGSIEDTPFFSNNPELQTLIVEKCFPLSPLVSYALLQVCEKSAQNERTLFTFLSRKGEGLDTFVRKEHHGFELLTLEYIYDYFEPLFMKDLYNPPIRENAIYVKSALKRTDNEEERSFIKALAVILIIDDMEYFRANREIICTAMLYSEDQYQRILQSLVKKGIVLEKRSDKNLAFAKKNSESLRTAIHDLMELNRTQINIRKELEDAVNLGYVIPRKYNDEKEMTRFFKHCYITTSELMKTENLDPFYTAKADGYILNLIYTADDDLDECIKKFQIIMDDKVILRMSDSPFAKQEELLERYAVSELIRKGLYSGDADALDELSFYQNDLEASLVEHIDHMYRSSDKIKSYYLGSEQSERNISRLVSDVCTGLYSKAPIINNEMINKSTISTQIRKAREKAIEYIFSSDNDISEYELSGSTPEITILKALKRANEDPFLKEAYTAIDDFIMRCEGKKQGLNKMFNYLSGKPFGIRKALIPLLFAYRVKRYLVDLTIYFNNKEMTISGELFSNIEDQPENYSIIIDHGSAERRAYTESLSDLFQSYSKNNNYTYNANSNIVRAIATYIKGLPRVTVEMARSGRIHLTDDADIGSFVISFIKADINPRDMLFDYLPSKFPGKGLVDTYESIFMSKDALDGYLSVYVTTLFERVKEFFSPEYKGSLKAALTVWFHEISKKSKARVFDSPVREFIRLIEEPNGHDDVLFINKLALQMTRFRIDDWTTSTEELFWDELLICKNELTKSQEESDNGELLSLSISVDEKTYTRSLVSEISPVGKTLLNNIEAIFSEYGDSITKEDRARVLLELLQKQI